MSAHNQRLLDLVRQQRMELHAGNLITDREYAELASDHGAVARLETYDQMRAELAALRRRCEDLIRIGSRMVQFVPNRDYSMLVRDWDALTDEARKALGGGQ